ncbi:MAG: methyltransferase domain-containing protein [Pacificimonas sp.]
MGGVVGELLALCAACRGQRGWPAAHAGCGSLVSTAKAHMASGRPTVLCDLSRGMMKAARDRIRALGGGVPDHLVFLQADLRGLPFRDGAFASVLAPGMLHLFEDVEVVTEELARISAPDASLWMSSLVADRALGRLYLNLLHRAGEVAAPRHAAALLARLRLPGFDNEASLKVERDGNMLFMTARRAARTQERPNR